MGYKSFLRSVSAANNRTRRESERQQKKQSREVERRQKKINSAEGRKEKIIDALRDVYAKGKIDREKFKELKKRENSISVDYIVAGKTPYVNLAKRYVCGKIDKEEFDLVVADVLPAEIIEEKRTIEEESNDVVEKMTSFRDECKINDVDKCQKCGKEKTFFSRLSEVEGLYLCRKCKSHFNELRKYKGFNGCYYTVEPELFNFSDSQNNKKIKVHFNSDLL